MPHIGGGLSYDIISPWGSSAMGFHPGGGGGAGGVCHMVLFPPGEVLIWDLFRGKVCHIVFLQEEGLPYGIISGRGELRGKNSNMTPAPLSKQVSLSAIYIIMVLEILS